MTEHKIGLMIGENKAFIERIAWYSVGVVNLLADVDHQNKTMADVLGTGPYSRGQSQSLHRRHFHPGTTQSAMCWLTTSPAIRKWSLTVLAERQLGVDFSAPAGGRGTRDQEILAGIVL